MCIAILYISCSMVMHNHMGVKEPLAWKRFIGKYDSVVLVKKLSLWHSNCIQWLQRAGIMWHFIISDVIKTGLHKGIEWKYVYG